MSRPDPTATGRSTGDRERDAQAAYTTHGVRLPGDVGTFVRDDTLEQDNPAPPIAGWRCQQHAVVVLVVPTGGRGDAHSPYIVQVRRWHADRSEYRHATVVADGTLAHVADEVRRALRAATGGGTHPLRELERFGE